MNDREYQKKLAFFQIAMTLMFTIGAIFIAMGLSQINNATTMHTFVISLDNEEYYNMLIDSINGTRDQGNNLMFFGTGILGLGTTFSIIIHKKF